MEATISISQLAQIIVFVLIVAVGVYAVFILRQINALTRHLHAMLNENQAHFQNTAAHLAQVLENSAAVSSQLREGFSAAGSTLKAIGRETADTVLTINKTADYVSTYALIIHEVLKSLIKLFSDYKK